MRVLVTGATGFFGRTFVHYLLKEYNGINPIERVAAFARSESRLAELSNKYRNTDPCYRPFLGDIRDEERLIDACQNVDLVVHAAALKRVDDGSYNPSEMIATNITGTQNVIKAALAASVSKVIVVSSDKAVAPINVYGATKFVAEQFAISYNAISAPRGTKVSVVRYGNVLGSTGSVLGIWQKQREANQPLTVTDPAMTRFVMTARDAVQLVLRVASFMEGGEVVVPKLSSTRLSDIAEAVAPKSEITYTGLRVGGEKMDEHLLNSDEQNRACFVGGVSEPQDIVVPPQSPSWVERQRWDDHSLCIDSAMPFPYSSGNEAYLTHTPHSIYNEIVRSVAESADY
jgi:UDP-N-acetylglucosamine 4,6-dehydratase